MKRLFVCLFWFPAAFLTLVAAFLTYSQVVKAKKIPLVDRQPVSNYGHYLSLPRVLGSFNASVETTDAIPDVVRQYTQGTPLEPYASYMVDICSRYDPKTEYPLVYWYLAIANVESGLCKKIPDGSHNCTGWGIHSAGTLKYPTYEAAIESWCKGFSEKYLDHPEWPKSTPDEVVKTHTPCSPIDQESGRKMWALKIERVLKKLMEAY